MVDLGRLEEFVVAAVEACPTIESYEIVHSESEFKDVSEHVRDWPLLVCVLPGATGDDGAHDNIAEKNEGLFFVLKPMTERQTRTERMDLWKLTAQGMKEFKEFLHQQVTGDFRDLFGDIDLKERTQQPEYNIADCNGWSLLFSYSTDWF